MIAQPSRKGNSSEYAYFKEKHPHISPFRILSWLRRTHLGVEKASQMFGVSSETIYKWINQSYY